MKETTIISYSGSSEKNMLSLDEDRSRFMLPFGGRFRIVDLIVRNTLSSRRNNLLLLNNFSDNLEEYINNYLNKKEKKPAIKVLTNHSQDLNQSLKLIDSYDTEGFILYNGDNPSIINFSEISSKFKKNKKKALIFSIKTKGKPDASSSLFAVQKNELLNLINSQKTDNKKSKNIFELIVHEAIKSGIKHVKCTANYWSLKNTSSYMSANMDILKKQVLANNIFYNSKIRNHINSTADAFINRDAEVSGSFISDGCKISGKITDSIIYPGVHVGEGTIIKNSIILPFVKIGNNSKIMNTIIDENIDVNNSDNLLNIGNECKIGSEHKDINNGNFPKALRNGITLIGKSCNLPDKASIGGGCYIGSGKGQEYLLRNKYLYNGESIP